MNWPLFILIVLCIPAALLMGWWLYDAPEIDADDADGLSDREREELRAIRDHDATDKERGPWG